jgi:hypothetical protein
LRIYREGEEGKGRIGHKKSKRDIKLQQFKVSKKVIAAGNSLMNNTLNKNEIVIYL